MTVNRVQGFFAYSSIPASVGDSIRTAIDKINSGGLVNIKGWEQMNVGGKLIIQQICQDIDQSELFCADLTDLNPNVMFELGYAIGKNKRIWLVRNSTYVASGEAFRQFKMFTTVGYANNRNSEELVQAFYHDEPFNDLSNTLFSQLIEPNLDDEGVTSSLLYMKERHQTEASIRLSNRIDHCKLRSIINDPSETAHQTLTWYGVKIYASAGVVCHMTSPEREGATLHNARYGMCQGF